MGEEPEVASVILYQNNCKTEDLNVYVYVNKSETNDNNLARTESQYQTPHSLVLKIFFANLVGLPVEKKDSFESKRVDCSLEKFFIATTSKKKLEYCFLKLAIRA